MIIISIDVETPFQSRTCQLAKVKEIIRVLDKYGAKATFFLSIFEKSHYPDEFIKIVSMLSGRDVQLHVHPERFFTNRSRRLSDYSLLEQMQIIQEAKSSFEKYFPAPVAFRAGGYFADVQTLQALIANEICIDSSFWTKIDFPNIFEIPIQTFTRKRFGIKLKRKIDIDWTKVSELEEIYQRINYLHIMGHSYSSPEKLEDILKEIDVSDISTIEEIAQRRHDLHKADLSLQFGL